MTVTSKGQVTIPKELRDKYGINEHTDVEFIDDGGAIRLVKKTASCSPIDSVYGILGRKKASTDALIKKLRGT